MELLVARIGRARGLRGEVALEMHSDSPRSRLAPGMVVETDPAASGPLTVAQLRKDPTGKWFARFGQAVDRDAAEALCGVRIVVEAAASEEPDAWYPHELAGLRAELPDGAVAGKIGGVEHLVAQDALVIIEPDGNRVLLPLVMALVPLVDVPGGRVVIDPPGGLLQVRPPAGTHPDAGGD